MELKILIVLNCCLLTFGYPTGDIGESEQPTKFFQVPNYETCLSSIDGLWCMPNGKPSVCNPQGWQQLQQLFPGGKCPQHSQQNTQREPVTDTEELPELEGEIEGEEEPREELSQNLYQEVQGLDEVVNFSMGEIQESALGLADEDVFCPQSNRVMEASSQERSGLQYTLTLEVLHGVGESCGQQVKKLCRNIVVHRPASCRDASCFQMIQKEALRCQVV